MIVWDKLKVTNSTNSITISPENNKIICGTSPLYLRQSNDQLLSLNTGTITASDITTETITAVGGRILLDKKTGVNGNTNIYAGKIEVLGGSSSSAAATLTPDDLSVSEINSNNITTKQLTVRGTTRGAILSPTTLGVEEIYTDRLATTTIGQSTAPVSSAYIAKLTITNSATLPIDTTVIDEQHRGLSLISKKVGFAFDAHLDRGTDWIKIYNAAPNKLYFTMSVTPITPSNNISDYVAPDDEKQAFYIDAEDGINLTYANIDTIQYFYYQWGPTLTASNWGVIPRAEVTPTGILTKVRESNAWEFESILLVSSGKKYDYLEGCLLPSQPGTEYIREILQKLFGYSDIKQLAEYYPSFTCYKMIGIKTSS